jgi:hypothetical protein
LKPKQNVTDKLSEVHMPTQSGDRPNPVTSENSPRTRADLKRRRFLMTLGAAGAGAGIVAARSIPSVSDVGQATEPVSADGSYAATAHVQTYYKTAKL